MIKGSIYEENITIIDICASNNRATKYMKQNLTQLKGKIYNSTIIFGD